MNWFTLLKYVVPVIVGVALSWFVISTIQNHFDEYARRGDAEVSLTAENKLKQNAIDSLVMLAERKAAERDAADAKVAELQARDRVRKQEIGKLKDVLLGGTAADDGPLSGGLRVLLVGLRADYEARHGGAGGVPRAESPRAVAQVP